MKMFVALVAIAIAVVVGLYFYGASIEPETSTVVQEAENVRE